MATKKKGKVSCKGASKRKAKKPVTKTKAKKVKKSDASKPTSASKATNRRPKEGGNRRRLSGLNAAAQVVKDAGKPMRAKEIIAAMAEQGLWKSPAGKTPWATLYSAMTREISMRGKESRFKRVDRGSFAFNG